MARRRLETQTHVRIYASDKRILDFIMRKRRITSQAEAFRLLLKMARRKKR